MKNIKYFYFALVCGMLASCETIEQEPISDITQSNAFETADDAESAIIGCYSTSYRECNDRWCGGDNFVAWGDARADEILTNDTGGEIIQISDNLLTTTNPYVDWSTLYRLVNNSNTVLANVAFD